MNKPIVPDCFFTGKGPCEGPVDVISNPTKPMCDAHARRYDPRCCYPGPCDNTCPARRPDGPFRDDMTMADMEQTMRERGLYITNLRRYDTAGGKRPSEFVVEGTSYTANRIVKYAEGNNLVDVLNRLAGQC